jgi:hypothetical protein
MSENLQLDNHGSREAGAGLRSIVTDDHGNTSCWKQSPLKFTEHAEALVIPAQGVTVFVGPNNAGLSA